MLIAEKMAACLIRESSDLNDKSSDDNGLGTGEMIDFAQLSFNLFQRKTVYDQRLIQVYKCKRWKEDHKRNKGRSLAFS